ncbi:Protein of unknown function [Cotesia congregata]|uniref:Reverse transcriptase domain-containing protein n=1 Tax=Cotesia congregata TaxID=51543 RepID=A0A8J2HEN9_COTCN|nr:Protein of unknown function [Cotesia congregata]
MLICDMIHGKTFIKWDGFNISTLIFVILEGMQQGTVTLLHHLPSNNTHSGAYADDTVVYVAHGKIPVIEQKLTTIVNQLYHYLKEWNLKMNADKSETILFRKTVNEITPQTIKIQEDKEDLNP